MPSSLVSRASKTSLLSEESPLPPAANSVSLSAPSPSESNALMKSEDISDVSGGSGGACIELLCIDIMLDMELTELISITISLGCPPPDRGPATADTTVSPSQRRAYGRARVFYRSNRARDGGRYIRFINPC
ncbi:protein of unknown function [Pseudodesulfovibrio piezophilus C1TLV30]|uniref:Uncharacterized protein n=1 Tax=Pseudodesulfovibrio piezophilus (strain DSM 21447 / JCM 15486 / C1TLV30) TaxID=1322246 RepID=M1WY80_PSEP2|nr:protein of unknown function [Pseudodesulfovibrio piezophilus C1TLV30]